MWFKTKTNLFGVNTCFKNLSAKFVSTVNLTFYNNISYDKS